MADPTPEQLRRQGMADAAVALVLVNRFPRATVEDLGEALRLRQRDLIDAVDRMKSGDRSVLRAAGRAPRSVDDIKAEIAGLRRELLEVEAAERARSRQEKQQARQAERARAAAEKQAAKDAARKARAEARAKAIEEGERVTIPAASYRNAGTCTVCWKHDVRNMGAHLRSHRTRDCEVCGEVVNEMAYGGHMKRHREAADA